jgi:hypothetical protein
LELQVLFYCHGVVGFRADPEGNQRRDNIEKTAKI